MSVEEGFIRWGELDLYVDEDNDLGLIVDGLTRTEWLELQAQLLAGHVEDVINGQGEDPDTVEMRALLLEILWADGEGEFRTQEDAEAWLHEAVVNRLTPEQALAIVFGDNNLFDGPVCWGIYDRPLGEIDTYANELTEAHQNRLANAAIQQLVLF